MNYARIFITDKNSAFHKRLEKMGLLDDQGAFEIELLGRPNIGELISLTPDTIAYDNPPLTAFLERASCVRLFRVDDLVLDTSTCDIRFFIKVHQEFCDWFSF